MILGQDLLLVISFSTAGAVWHLSRSRRQEKDPKNALSKIHPGELDDLDEFLGREGDFLAADGKFWELSGKTRGLIRKRSNAVYLVQLCLILSKGSDMNPETTAYMTRRSMLISFLIGCSVIEAVLRLFVRDLPHLCARNATQLYWDMELRAKVLFREYYELNPTIADSLNSLLYRPIGRTHAN